MKVALPEAARDKPLEVWYQDEARVGQQGTLTRTWAERGTRPRAPQSGKRKFGNKVGAFQIRIYNLIVIRFLHIGNQFFYIIAG